MINLQFKKITLCCRVKNEWERGPRVEADCLVEMPFQLGQEMMVAYFGLIETSEETWPESEIDRATTRARRQVSSIQLDPLN